MIKVFYDHVPIIRNKKKGFRKLAAHDPSEITISAVGAETSDPAAVSSDETEAVDIAASIPADATMIGVLPPLPKHLYPL